MDFPNASDFESRRVTNPAQSEVIRQRFYDYQLYATAGASQLVFFAQPKGQGVTTALGATVGSVKTDWDTNLDLSNSVPSGKAYMIQSIEVLILPGASAAANTYTPATIAFFNAALALSVLAAANDINTLYQSGLLELNILSKNYLRETPLLAFPPKAMFAGDYAITATVAAGTTGGFQITKAAGRPYYIEPEIALQPAVNFDVTLKWPAPVATGSGFNARLGVLLDGYFMRASQ